MPRTIICTTGTSIAGGPINDASEKAYLNAIRDRVQWQRTQCSPLQFLQCVSAESNSLLALKLAPEDNVALLHTETPDGRICAEELSRLLQSDIGCSVSLSRIEGLQVTDASRFRKTGIQCLFQELDRLVTAAAGRDVTLNATGGFKAVVPYLTLFGLVHHLPVVYLFERSASLITLPPAPFTFDYEAVSRAAYALRILEERTTMPRAEFFQLIPGLEYHERERIEPLIEDVGNDHVMPSVFALLILQHAQLGQARIFLSTNAKHALDTSSGQTRSQFLFMLSRLHDPLWRAGKHHVFKGTDLTVYKPGNTSERAACILRGHTVYVCELLQHDEYRRILPGKRSADYDLSTFTEWFPPDEAASLPTSEEERYVQLIKENKDIKQLCEHALAENQKLITQRDAALRERNDALQATDAARAELAHLKATQPRGFSAIWFGIRTLFAPHR